MKVFIQLVALSMCVAVLSCKSQDTRIEPPASAVVAVDEVDPDDGFEAEAMAEALDDLLDKVSPEEILGEGLENPSGLIENFLGTDLNIGSSQLMSIAQELMAKINADADAESSGFVGLQGFISNFLDKTAVDGDWEKKRLSSRSDWFKRIDADNNEIIDQEEIFGLFEKYKAQILPQIQTLLGGADKLKNKWSKKVVKPYDMNSDNKLDENEYDKFSRDRRIINHRRHLTLKKDMWKYCSQSATNKNDKWKEIVKKQTKKYSKRHWMQHKEWLKNLKSQYSADQQIFRNIEALLSGLGNESNYDNSAYAGEMRWSAPSFDMGFDKEMMPFLKKQTTDINCYALFHRMADPSWRDYFIRKKISDPQSIEIELDK